ncbi:MAG: V-type ATP synthase subunit E [Spirochaetaceae bacterium]|jgi:V/A-type H+-transporting ATPase subunit E|nr:V-type ATP synthase subunit E [Spirochaetaceae bacterium]
MDVQLQELIDKIKKDGVESAESSAAAIVAEAEKKAAAIIQEAEKSAADLVAKAKIENDRAEKAGVASIRQAARNLIISFRDSIVAELSALVASETEKAFDPSTLKTLIPEVVKNWFKDEDADSVSVLLSEKDLAAVESGFKSALKDELAKGLEVKADASLSAGFRVGVKNGAAYYDFSAEAVAELFSSYLNPRIAEILKAAAKEIGEGGSPENGAAR